MLPRNVLSAFEPYDAERTQGDQQVHPLEAEEGGVGSGVDAVSGEVQRTQAGIAAIPVRQQRSNSRCREPKVVEVVHGPSTARQRNAAP